MESLMVLAHKRVLARSRPRSRPATGCRRTGWPNRSRARGPPGAGAAEQPAMRPARMAAGPLASGIEQAALRGNARCGTKSVLACILPWRWARPPRFLAAEAAASDLRRDSAGVAAANPKYLEWARR